MALIAPQDFKFRGLPAPGAYLRLDQHSIQTFKEQRSAHIIVAIFANEAAFRGGEQPLNPSRRYMTVNLVADKPTNRPHMDDNSPDGTISLTVWCPDITRWWGHDPVNPEFTDEEWAGNAGYKSDNDYAQAYLILSKLPQLAGFVSDVPV
jgi:hypothetical protein